MPDYAIVDSHVHLLQPGRFGYAWTKGQPSLDRQVLPGDLTRAAAPVEIDRFVSPRAGLRRPMPWSRLGRK